MAVYKTRLSGSGTKLAGSMDHLWTPWRYRYITEHVTEPGERTECVFCAAAACPNDSEALVVHRAERNFIIVNRFPYTSGHVMVAPYQHAPSLEDLPGETLAEMILLARDCEKRIRALYRPDGLNMGLNIGKSAGAGVADHLHLHVLPRWTGDANFMTAVAETRILPEEVATTWQRLREAFESQ
jgi:ATP adenylyltransferase